LQLLKCSGVATMVRIHPVLPGPRRVDIVSLGSNSALRTFTLPALAQVHRRLSELMEDPEPVMRQLVRVFIDDGTFCPGFQFLPGGQLQPTVTALFSRAMELDIPHNYFTLWMITPSGPWPGPAPSTT
jgi:hypothetical protein